MIYRLYNIAINVNGERTPQNKNNNSNNNIYIYIYIYIFIINIFQRICLI